MRLNAVTVSSNSSLFVWIVVFCVFCHYNYLLHKILRPKGLDPLQIEAQAGVEREAEGMLRAVGDEVGPGEIV